MKRKRGAEIELKLKNCFHTKLFAFIFIFSREKERESGSKLIFKIERGRERKKKKILLRLGNRISMTITKLIKMIERN